ncbi:MULTISPECIES: AAA family ATPase [Methylomicrobium]|uniref:Cytidylate kinase n=1 Tax=Methylomicrobium album BG8 TaxID=686340 RepID=H8GL14_METAL|nr:MULTISPECIES: AAA family ATPase [Methylomicrobium]EIC30495.1 cytidylate kinase [Methylomicrobium album BG8]
MKHIITLSGDIGSGKSSVAAELQKLTEFDIIGTGKIQRAIAERRGLTTLELNKISETDRSVDDEIDNYVIETGKTQDRLIIDSRLAWHFIPAAFKVYLSVDPLIGAERVFGAGRSDEHNPSLEATLQNNLKRQSYEDQRFYKLYNVHFRLYRNYDLVVDTSYTAPETIARKIYACFEQRNQGGNFPALWLDPRRLSPTHAPAPEAAGQANPDFDFSRPISVFVHDGLIYIAKGHKKALAARRAGIDLLPARILTEEMADPKRRFSELAVAVPPSVRQAWEAEMGIGV